MNEQRIIPLTDVLNDPRLKPLESNITHAIPILLRENQPDDLSRLETLLVNRLITEAQVISHLIYNWSAHQDSEALQPLPKTSRSPLYLQYEGLRDGDQIAVPGVARLSRHLDVAQQIFPHLPAFGVQVADLGMPISGSGEREKILQMIKFIAEQQLPIQPAVAGRTHQDDVAAITELTRYAHQHFNMPTWVYAFVGSSRIRMLAEGQNKWNIDTLKRWIIETVTTLKQEPSVSKVIVPLEDTFGAHPPDLDILIRTAFEAGADGICICDTCSRGYTPDWTKNLIRFIGNTISPDYPGKIWELHTHNMLGDAASNALTGYQEGLISGVHGTLGGVGDLGGNMPLERFVMHAMQAGFLSPNEIELHTLRDLVNTVLTARNITPDANPFLGGIYSSSSRMVPSGVHASAFGRLEEIGPHLGRIFQYVYFPLAPEKLGLGIHLDVITPVSGKSNVLALAKRLGVTDQLIPEKIAAILDHARTKGEPLTDDEFLSHFSSSVVVFQKQT